ncbi:uncharacterized protein DNG_05150 [Cephalotrichum gorgonifer]|uniref:Uncharacterized protein n=1 Tax=Cephalotrichum gorgonifer TaxID=2041049 RepID=A0AAE8SW07_9PEZI|nr:uncharacterized protein DNG_05150 [Cephalotrichum gorgonifer]
MPYFSRHVVPIQGGAPPRPLWGPQARKEYEETPLEPNEEDEDLLEDLKRRGPLTQEEMELVDDIYARQNDRRDAKCAPVAREMESYFEHLNLPPLPPPLPRSSLELSVHRADNSEPKELRPFYMACHEGRLDEVKEWVQDQKKRDSLRKKGLPTGLDFAAKGNQVHVARYLVEEVGVTIHGEAVRAACTNLSLPLFELFVRNGYHPNQQVPSDMGLFGTALSHCLGSEAVTLFLLKNGADPDIAPFADARPRLWGRRSTPPMDRFSGRPLDDAAARHRFDIAHMLLEHGANPKYSRPLLYMQNSPLAEEPSGVRDDWRQLTDALLRHGAKINAKSRRHGGSAISEAVALKRWDVAEYLLERGANPRAKSYGTDLEEGVDCFEIAARRAGIPWDETEEVRRYLDYLCKPGSSAAGAEAVAAPDGVDQNPLVQMMGRLKSKREEDEKTA